MLRISPVYVTTSSEAHLMLRVLANRNQARSKYGAKQPKASSNKKKALAQTQIMRTDRILPIQSNAEYIDFIYDVYASVQ